MNLIFLKYNNYYNRIVKRAETVNQYTSSGLVVAQIINSAFIINDGLTATQVVNDDFIEGHPDYMIATEDNTTVHSRWFVIDAVELRKGQYRCSLMRDVIAEWYNEVVNAPAFVERGMPLASSPLIYNREGSTYNQVLQSQTLLKDKSGCGWAVGYISKDTLVEDTEITTEVNPDSDTTDFTTSNLSSFLSNYGASYNAETGRTNAVYPYFSEHSTFNVIYVENSSLPNAVFVARVDSNGSQLETLELNVRDFGVANSSNFGNDIFWALPGDESKYDEALAAAPWIVKNFPQHIEQIKRDCYTLFSDAKVLNSTETKNILSLNGKTIYNTTDGIKYKMTIDTFSKRMTTTKYCIPGLPSYNSMKAGTNYEKKDYYGSPLGLYYKFSTELNFSVTYDEYPISVVLTPETTGIKTNISSMRYHLEDSPYDMFAIPYGEIKVMSGLDTVEINKTIKNAALMMATAIGEKAGRQFDIQLLPYCPCPWVLTDKEGVINVRQTNVDYIEDEDKNKVSVILWGISSTFTFNIPYQIEPTTNVVEKKVNVECDVYRLCSPNYNGIFEFNPEINNGVEYIQVMCTYKPFNPFIQLKPNFGGLYGINPDKDSRGLICSGDFSLAQVNDAWVNYELNNKNYNATFERQVKNLEIQQDKARTLENVNALTGIFSGATGGAMTGGMMGGPWGAAAGAIIGTGASIGGAYADYQINESLRKEQLSYMKDMQSLNLGSIQAIPDSLSKTSSLVYSNKIFPFVEYYTATTTEKNALRNKIQYTSMNLGVIANVKNYQRLEPSFIQARLIRLEDIEEDYHIVRAISDELSKGVFI